MITMFTRTHKDIESVFRKTTKNRKKMKYRKKRGMVALIGILFVFIQFLVSVLFLKNLKAFLCHFCIIFLIHNKSLLYQLD